MNRAVFLDRDGVLIEDTHLLTESDKIKIMKRVPESLQKLKESGYLLIVVSNQAVVSRGLMTEQEAKALQAQIERKLVESGAPPLSGFYFCPHHPNATMLPYRKDCDCRKPRPGLLLRAAREYEIDLASSFIIGDRITDIIAGARAGCRTILVQTGAHLAPPIETSSPLDTAISPDYICANLDEAMRWILKVGLA